MSDSATMSGPHITRRLYRTFEHEHYDTERGVNGPYFPRGCCGGGNANGGIFHRPNGESVPRPESASPGRLPPRMDNLGNMAHLAPGTRRQPFGAAPDRMFAAQLTPPNQPFSTRGRQFEAAPGPGGAQMYALKLASMGALGAVSRSRTPFSTWKEGRATLLRDTTEPAWKNVECEANPNTLARPQNLGSSRKISPFDFYTGADCLINAAPYNTRKVFNPLATR